ncbi:HAMP domain-containing sensor histidine kinase [Hyalangium sp.]|uniref:sensor histidine kinase n=1 Tax=Hyalangium sp. TaxID=2028555 RepID=UPI002D3ACBB3|nr:HAMP domain-containing sensor histidine kinase [Hyalangium sp.]HYH96611.1 HAMP domain-containing sensor histidine kinase [Hyalangium sp.]
MWRRLLPVLAGIGLGLAVLAVGLGSLHGIFAREREEGRRALEDRRRALELYARQALTDSLRRALEEAGPRLQQAAVDPLVPDSDLLLFRAGRQLLPRTSAPRGGPAAPAQMLHGALEARGPGTLAAEEDPEEPWAQRLLLMDRFLAALKSADASGVERTLREWLSHRARFVLPVAKDTVAALWLLERFQAGGRPDPLLMRSLLRDGVQGVSGARVEGLQRVLLDRREAFGHADFAFLRARIAQLSELTHVDYVDFNQRAAAEPGMSVPLSLPLAEAELRPEGWYVEPLGKDGARGIQVGATALIERVREQMRERALLDDEDRLALSRTDTPALLSTLAVALESPRTVAAVSELESRYRLKTLLLGFSGALALAIVGLAVLAHERKVRFLALRSEFVSTVSHELRTPLSAIRVMAETLERRVGGMPGAGNYPSRIIAEADALGRLVENILTYNRLEKGRWEARREQVPLEPLIQRVVEDAAAQNAARVELKAEGLAGLSVPGDPELLRMLFSNLVHNACRYTTRSPVELRVEARKDGATVVRFSDNGVGIPRESWEAVFEEFRRLRREELPARGGSGLGLAICRRILSLHGGTLRVAASSPEGTTFEMTFPPA